MKKSKFFYLILAAITISLAAAGCTSGPCEITANEPLTIYRLPDAASDVFSTLPAGETREVLAYTANGFVGFDPGFAQAGNIGLYHHRWVLLNASLSPFCLAEVEQVTLADVLADAELVYGVAIMAITDVQLTNPILTENAFSEVEVTVENQGDVTSSDYDLVLLSQYGKGPNQNPAGVEPVPDLAPGASHTITFSPGVSYPTAGTYTMRALLTDNWATHADPDSTGSFGDKWDTEINVILDMCNPFEGIEPAFVLLNLNPETRNLPVYMKVADGVFPGFDQDPSLPYEARLGMLEAYQIDQQGYPNRAYFMFNIPEGLEGTDQLFTLWLPDCPQAVFELPAVQIPEPLPVEPVCSADLGERACEASGGTYKENRASAGGECICP